MTRTTACKLVHGLTDAQACRRIMALEELAGDLYRTCSKIARHDLAVHACDYGYGKIVGLEKRMADMGIEVVGGASDDSERR